MPPAAGFLRLRVLRGLIVDAIKWVIEQKGDRKRWRLLEMGRSVMSRGDRWWR